MARRKSKNFSVRIPVLGGATAVIDSGDVELVKQYTWRIGGTDGRSVISDMDEKTIRLENLIMGVMGKVEVTFSDSNKLNFRRSNLHVDEANSTNTFRGVIFHPSKQRFQARVFKNRLAYRGPYRLSVDEAASDYDAMARGIIGSKAVLNFPTDEEKITPRSHAYPETGEK